MGKLTSIIPRQLGNIDYGKANIDVPYKNQP